MMWIAFEWACVAIVVAGSVIFARKWYATGFALSAVSAVMWAILAIHNGLYGMAALEIFLLGASLYGLWNHKKERHVKAEIAVQSELNKWRNKDERW